VQEESCKTINEVRKGNEANGVSWECAVRKSSLVDRVLYRR
jgi:hypothetical protein